MDTATLIQEARARFNHIAAKAQLKDKYDSKLIIADQGGLWKANLETITFLSAMSTDDIVLIDTFDNPVKVNRKELLDKLQALYTTVMEVYYEEWKTLEKSR
jgi:DNA polymerase III delta subunit